MQVSSSAGAPGDARQAWGMLARGFLIQNVAMGCTFGAFGISVLSVEREFETTRALASFGVALIMLSMSLMSPPLAAAMDRFGLKRAFVCGLLLSALGYVAAAAAPNIWVLLAAFLLLIGPGATAAGTLPATVLASRWFEHRQGRAVGLVNMPLFVMLTPIVAVVVLERYGLRTLYLALAATQLAVLPAAIGIRDRPTVREPDDAAAARATAASAAPRLSRSDLLRRPEFWVVAVAAATMSAIGITAVTHLAALTIENGCTPEQATTLVVLFGAASTAGSVVFGWLADRIPAVLALVIDALVMALGWSIALGLSGMPLMAASALAMGLAGGGLSTARNVLTRRLFGAESLGPAMALAGLCALPLTFGFPPLVGYLRDLSGDYGLSGATVIASSLAAATAFVGLWLAKRRSRAEL